MPGTYYSPQLTPSTPSAPSISYAYPQSQAQFQPNTSRPNQQNQNQNPYPFSLPGPGQHVRMAYSGASTPVPTSPVVAAHQLPRSSSMMDFGTYGMGLSQGNAFGGGGGGMGKSRLGVGWEAGVGMNKTEQGAPPSPPPTTLPSSFDPSQYIGIAPSSTSSGPAEGNLGMSISPPNWGSWGNNPSSSYSANAGVGSYGAGTAANGWGYAGAGGGGGSFVGSLQMGQSFGRERDRELEARYTKDFSCCGRELKGLHELLEHYEEEHNNLSPDARFAALSAAQAPPGHPRPSFTMPNPSVSSVQPQSGIPRPHGSSSSTSISVQTPQNVAGEAPVPPGMMDLEMDDGDHTSVSGSGGSSLGTAGYGGQAGYGIGQGYGMTQNQQQQQQQQQPASPWASAFRPVYSGSAGIPPSLLTMPANTAGMGGGGIQQNQQPTLQNQGQSQGQGQAQPTYNINQQQMGLSPQQQHQQQQQQQQPYPAQSQQHIRPITPHMGHIPNQPYYPNSGPSGIIPSYNPSSSSSANPAPAPGPPLASGSGAKHPLSAEELEARAIRKAQRKAEKAAKKAADEAAGIHHSGDEDGSHESEKKFPCPIEGCGKVYKQANGLKYHLTRSINSGHGNVAALGLAGALESREGG